jgi:hypothetical protein
MAFIVLKKDKFLNITEGISGKFDKNKVAFYKFILKNDNNYFKILLKYFYD